MFLDEIERYAASELTDLAVENRLCLVFHLMGEWRETRAYRPLARLLRCAPDRVDRVLGGGITETSDQVMAAVFDGDPQPLYDIVLDSNSEEFIRSRMCEVVAMVALREALPRQEAARFLRDSFMEIHPQSECPVWVGWQAAIAMLGLVELASLVAKAFEQGYIHRLTMHFKHFQDGLAAMTRALAAAEKNSSAAASTGEGCGRRATAIEDAPCLAMRHRAPNLVWSV